MGQNDVKRFFDKSILIVEKNGFLEKKVRSRLIHAGARIIGPLADFAETELAVGLFEIDAVIIDLALNSEVIIEVVEILEQFKIEYLFASISAGRVHPDQFVLSSDISDLENIARALFGSSYPTVTIH